jgi:hypothetical protein
MLRRYRDMSRTSVPIPQKPILVIRQKIQLFIEMTVYQKMIMREVIIWM